MTEKKVALRSRTPETGLTKDCLDPWVYIEFQINGGIRPCCVREPVGNIHRESLANILNGQKIKDLRRSLLTGEIDETCRACGLRGFATPDALQAAVKKVIEKAAAPDDFDTESYLVANPDVAAANADPRKHFALFGRIEGRSLSKKPARTGAVVVDGAAYLDANPDLRDIDIDPVKHFLEIGQFEGRPLRRKEQGR